jgi:hypothetical protein
MTKPNTIAVPAPTPRSPVTLTEWLADAKRHRADAHQASLTALRAGDHAGHVKFARLESAIADLIATQN